MASKDETPNTQSEIRKKISFSPTRTLHLGSLPTTSSSARLSVDNESADSVFSRPSRRSCQRRIRSAEPRIHMANVSEDAQLTVASTAGTYLIVPPGNKSSEFNNLKETIPEIEEAPRPSKIPICFSKTKITDNMFPLSSKIEASVKSSSSNFLSLGNLLAQGTKSDPRGTLDGEQDTTQIAKPFKNVVETQEKLFHLKEERVEQKRIVSVNREECHKKMHVALSSERDKSSAKQHRVTVSRSHTWSFNDKSPLSEENRVKRPRMKRQTLSQPEGEMHCEEEIDIDEGEFEICSDRARSNSIGQHSQQTLARTNTVQSYSLRDNDFKQNVCHVYRSDDPGCEHVSYSIT